MVTSRPRAEDRTYSTLNDLGVAPGVGDVGVTVADGSSGVFAQPVSARAVPSRNPRLFTATVYL
jgi:hypothetical protein